MADAERLTAQFGQQGQRQKMRATPMSRVDRDGRVSAIGPLRQPLSVATLIARDIGLILLLPALVVVAVAWVAGDGFAVSVPVQSVEPDDRVRSFD